jgi:1-acyl-sn-glycerol-3-phosphate acyltransferase
MVNKRDPKFISVALFFARPLLRLFRTKVFGMEKLVGGPYILVSNHNIGAPYEIFALLSAWEKQFNYQRPAFGLAHSFVFRLRRVGDFFSKLGFIPATYASGFEALDAGYTIAIFPGGAYETTRPFTQRHLCDFKGRKGFVKIALTSGIPVVPVSIEGSHSVNPVLIRSQLLARALVLPWILGVKWFPVTCGQIIFTFAGWMLLSSVWPLWLTIFACYFIFLVSVFAPVWPAKIRILIGEPISLKQSALPGITERELLEYCYKTVTSKIQAGMDYLVDR